MPTSHYAFRALPLEQQLPLVWVEGRFLARRWEEEDGVSLYHMEGDFFCEVYLNPETLEILRLRTFRSIGPLEDYMGHIYLTDLFTT